MTVAFSAAVVGCPAGVVCDDEFDGVLVDGGEDGERCAGVYDAVGDELDGDELGGLAGAEG